jgi:hypothetical protein
MLKFNKFIFIVFLSFSLIIFDKSLFSQLPDLPDLNLQEQNLSELQELLGVFGEGDFANFKEDFFPEISKKSPAQIAENLPNELKDEVLSVWENSGDVSNKIMDPMISVLDTCVYLNENLLQEELKDLIVKIWTFLVSEQFNKNIKVNFYEINLLDSEEKENFYSELNNLKASLVENITRYGTELDEEILRSLMVLNDIFLSFCKGDSLLFFTTINNFEKDGRINVKHLFDSTLKKLDDALVQEQSDDSREALLYFRNDILGGLKPVINSVKENGDIDKIALRLAPLGFLGEPLLKVIKFADKNCSLNKSLLFSYGFYKKFLNHYLLDNGYSWKLFFGDELIIHVLLLVFILKKVADLKPALESSSDKELILAAQGSLLEIGKFYSDPNYLTKKANWPVRSIYRIVSSLAYYNFWYKNKFDLNDDIYPITYRQHHDRINSTNEAGDSNYKYWPKEFKHLKNAIWFSIKDGYSSLGSALQDAIYANVDKGTLNKIENNSLGLIKPALINFTLNTFMPVLAENYFPQSILDLEKETVFASEKVSALNLIKKRSNKMGMLSFSLGYMNNQDYINYVGNNDFKNISSAQYIEGRVLGYMAVNMGKLFGEKIGYKLRNKFDYFGGKILVNLAEKIGFEFNEIIEGLSLENEEFKKLSDNKKKLYILKEMIKEQIYKIFYYNGIIDMQVLQEAQEIDPVLKIVLQMRNIFFSWLVNEGIFTQVQILEIENEFKTTGVISDEKLEFISNSILDKIKGVIAQKIGGFAGALSSWKIADMLVKKHTIDTPLYTQFNFN